MTAGGACSLNASARASAARTSGDGSSSSMISAPSAAARSSGGQIGIEIGARQRGGGFGPLAGWRGAYPLEKLTNDHAATDAWLDDGTAASAGQ